MESSVYKRKNNKNNFNKTYQIDNTEKLNNKNKYTSDNLIFNDEDEDSPSYNSKKEKGINFSSASENEDDNTNDSNDLSSIFSVDTLDHNMEEYKYNSCQSVETSNSEDYNNNEKERKVFENEIKDVKLNSISNKRNNSIQLPLREYPSSFSKNKILKTKKTSSNISLSLSLSTSSDYVPIGSDFFSYITYYLLNIQTFFYTCKKKFNYYYYNHFKMDINLNTSSYLKTKKSKDHQNRNKDKNEKLDRRMNYHSNNNVFDQSQKYNKFDRYNESMNSLTVEDEEYRNNTSISSNNENKENHYYKEINGRLPLITFTECPKWLADNKYVINGYRPPCHSYLSCIRSLFYLHNESVRQPRCF